MTASHLQRGRPAISYSGIFTTKPGAARGGTLPSRIKLIEYFHISAKSLRADLVSGLKGRGGRRSAAKAHSAARQRPRERRNTRSRGEPRPNEVSAEHLRSGGSAPDPSETAAACASGQFERRGGQFERGTRRPTGQSERPSGQFERAIRAAGRALRAAARHSAARHSAANSARSPSSSAASSSSSSPSPAPRSPSWASASRTTW